MKERYERMMQQVKLSEERRSAMETALTCCKKTYRPMMLAAACLCALLIGIVAAAVQYSSVLVVNPRSDTGQSGFDVSIKSVEKELSDAVRTDLENGTLREAFLDRKSLEDYLAFSLIHSELLENAGIVEDLEESFEHGWNVRPELKNAPDARYVLTTDDQKEVIRISAHRVVSNYEVFLDAQVSTGKMEGTVTFEGETFGATSQIDHKMTVDEEGNVTYEPVFYKSAEKQFSYENYTTHNGIEATIVTAQDIHQDGSLGFKDYIAYFVHDGVLYSVYPYGIYDPTLDQNYANGYELQIIKKILISFEP